MAVIQGRTRKELRQSIGYNLGALYVGSATSTGSTTTLVDTSLTTVIGGNDDHKGKWIIFTSGDNDGDIARVTDYVASSTTLTFAAGAGVTVGASTVSGNTYELWDGEYAPTRIHDFINQAVISATGQVYDPIEDISLHSDGHTLRFDIPSNISMIQDILFRNSIESTRLHACNGAFDEHTTLVATTLNGAISDATATSVTVTSASTLRAEQQILVGSEKMTISSISSNTLTVSRGAGGTTAATHSDGANVLMFPIVDTEDKKQGTGANKFVIATGASAGNITTDSITSKDISKYDYLECWIKSTVATSAGNLKILLDDSASCASPIETLLVPALTADTWTFVRMSLDNAETDTAIISVGLEYDSDLGACTVWVDDISVVRNDTAEWIKVPRNLWRIDKQSQEIIFDSYFDGLAPYDLLKIVGGDKPALLSADSTSNEISDVYVMQEATGRAFLASDRRELAAPWLTLSSAARRNFPMLTNVRTIN